MTTLDNLLRAIIEDPQNDDLRKVYADALEEQGEEERAAFIRVQCRIASMPCRPACDHRYRPPTTPPWPKPACPGCRHGKEVKRLLCRQRELLHANYCRWTADLPELPRVNTGADHLAPYTFRRGFVDEVRVPTVEAWTGGACPMKCQRMQNPGGGTSTHYQHWSDYEESYWEKCRHCGGTGTTPGVGPAVVRCQPVQVVRATDRDPYHNEHLKDRSWSWWADGYGSPDHPASDLPREVYRLLPERHMPSGWKWYPTRALADAALSTALIRHARGER